MSDSSSTFLARAYRADTFVYNIDIVGTCNLRCPSCPVGNVPVDDADRGTPARGLMPYARFEAILDKIVAECPVGRPVIGLYNWGEPLLHPDIGRFVRLARGRGLYTAVSTNLNHARYLEDLVISEPSNIKISMSGFTQAIYGRTHAGGRVERVKANLRLLRELIDRHGTRIDVFVGYHDYIGNDGTELAGIEALTRELGFGLRHKIARLSPLEKLLPLSAAGAVPAPPDRAVFDLLLVKPSEWSVIATAGGVDRACVMREQEMTINFDGSVALCCNVFDYAHNVAPDFLVASHDDLQAAKSRQIICSSCSAAGYPKSCGLDADPAVQQIVAARRRSADTAA